MPFIIFMIGFCVTVVLCNVTKISTTACIIFILAYVGIAGSLMYKWVKAHPVPEKSCEQIVREEIEDDDIPQPVNSPIFMANAFKKVITPGEFSVSKEELQAMVDHCNKAREERRKNGTKITWTCAD